MTTADAIKELLDHWTHVEKSLVEALPVASREEIYRLTAEAMNLSLGLPAPCAVDHAQTARSDRGL